VVSPGARLYLLDVPYHERGIANANGARWDPFHRATIYIGDTLPDGLHPYRSQPFSWERWREDDINQTSGAIPEPSTKLILRPHQREAAQAILDAARVGARGFLLADEVGTGKTLSAIGAIEELAKLRPIKNLLIVSPLSVVPHWRRNVIDKNLAGKGIRVCVINYDRLKKLLDVPASAHAAKRTRTKNKRIAKEGASIVSWDAIIFDEAHKLRNQDSQRSQVAARLAAYNQPRDKSPFVIWASATIAHTPIDASFLAPLLAQVTRNQMKELKDFGPWLQENGFHVIHESRFNKWSWTEDPVLRGKDIAHLRHMLFERKTPVAIRRLPTDLAGWPEVTRSLLPVELGPMEKRLYREAWTEFRKEMRLAQRGKDPKGGMVARLRFRQKASLLRINGTVEHTLDLMENGHQVVIACQFLESLDHVKEGLEKNGIGVATMDGRNPSNRESERIRFQRGEVNAILVTPVEGYSLHQEELLPDGTHATSATRSLIVHDLRFSGIEQAQLEGRAHRDGKAAHVFLAYGVDTVEHEVAQTLLSRVESMKAMVGDETSTIKALEAALLKGH